MTLTRYVNRVAREKIEEAILLETNVNAALEIQNAAYDIPKVRIMYAGIQYLNYDCFLVQENNGWKIQNYGGFLGHDIHDIQKVLTNIQNQFDNAYQEFVEYFTKNYYHIIIENKFPGACNSLMCGGPDNIQANLEKLYICMDVIFLDTIKNFSSLKLWEHPVDAQTFYPVGDWLSLQISQVIFSDGVVYDLKMINTDRKLIYQCENEQIRVLCETVTNTFEYLKNLERM